MTTAAGLLLILADVWGIITSREALCFAVTGCAEGGKVGGLRLQRREFTVC
jgi:hypothetical protein